MRRKFSICGLYNGQRNNPKLIRWADFSGLWEKIPRRNSTEKDKKDKWENSTP